MNNRWIVITSINVPSDAVLAYASMKNYELVVVGDKKTNSKMWTHSDLHLHFLSLDEQKKLPYLLSGKLHENKYQRKNLGYLYAIANGAEVIIDTDDDNIPQSNWLSQWNDLNQPSVKSDYIESRWVNMYQYYTRKKVWPRGFPLDEIQNRSPRRTRHSDNSALVGIIQGLADGDPDVDAIYRLTDNTPIYFSKRKKSLHLAPSSYVPINSQNTAFISSLFPLLYLPSTVTFRSTDIIRGYVAQPILWKLGYMVAVSNAGVVQIRNPHDYLDDFQSEIPIYLNSKKIVSAVEESISNDCNIYNMLLNAYISLEKRGIVMSEEIDILQAWLKDIQNPGQKLL